MTFENFFTPRSVAIVGASHTPGKVGYAILENMKASFKGKIFPVNPDTTEILGLEVFPSITKIREKVDLALIVVKTDLVNDVLVECKKKKIDSVIIVSSGFSEMGEEGKKLEEKLKKTISSTTINVIGPNCLGVFDTYSGLDTLFLSHQKLARPGQGNIAFISQSGAVGSSILDFFAEEKVGISKFISYGNSMDLNELDLLEFLAKDEKTKVIMMYLEGIKSQGREFVDKVKKITKIKPIIVLKAGKTERGTKAVMSHTGSLAGSYRVYSSVFKQTGIIEAKDWEELIDFAKAFSMQPLPRGKKLLVVTDGGGFGILAADEAEKQKLDLKEPSDELKNKLKKMLPPYVSLHNPIDLSGDTTAERYEIVLREASGEYDGVVVIALLQVPALEERVVDVLANFKKEFQKTLICCSAGGKYSRRILAKMEEHGIPVFVTPEDSVGTFSAMFKYFGWLTRKFK